VFFPDINWSLSNDTVIIGTIFATLTLSYLLYSFNNPLIRLAEGYIWRRHPLLIMFQQKHQEQYRKLYDLSRAGNKEALQEIDTHFPSDEKYVMATSLGNTIAAFEHYSYTRYGIDAVALWPRMLPILQDNHYIDFVSQQKTVFDFLLNMMFATILVGFELTGLYSYWGQLKYSLICIPVTVFLVWVFYLGAISGAVLWGSSVRVAFDLYRGELWNLLHLRPVRKYSEEVERWKDISQLIRGDSPDYFDGFVYQKSKVRFTSKALKPKALKPKGE
jgi:hypothetical protein